MIKLERISDMDTPSYKFLSASSKTSFADTSSSWSQESSINDANLFISRGTLLPSFFVMLISGTSGISISGVCLTLS